MILLESGANVDGQVAGQEFDFTCQPKSLPKEHSIPYLKLIGDTKKYKKDPLYFLENPKLLYNSHFYCGSRHSSLWSPTALEYDGFSIGAFKSASLTDVSLDEFFSMYISRSKPLEPKFQGYLPPTYDPEEVSRISCFCRGALSLGLTGLKVLVLHQIFLDDNILDTISCLKLELLHLISCWWQWAGFEFMYRDGRWTTRQCNFFKRLHITLSDNPFYTNGSLLHDELEEFIINSHSNLSRPLCLDASECYKLKHM